MATVIGNLEDIDFFPYNSVQTALGDEDRLYDAEDWAASFGDVFATNGIIPDPPNGLMVESLYNSMVLTLRRGIGRAGNRRCKVKKDFDFTVTPAHLTLGRRDIVIIRHDVINRTCLPFYIDGTPASVPLFPQIIRTDDVVDILLARITVNPNAQSITTANIDTSVRFDPDVCGIVATAAQLKTDGLVNQYQAALNDFLALSEIEQQRQIDYWQKQTDKQQTVSDAQLAKQKSEWESWFARINVDIQIIATFNFDNLAALPFTERKTVFAVDGHIEETITVKESLALIATQETRFNADGTITAIEKVYKDGVTIIRQANITTIFNEDGSITEVVS